MTERLDHVDLAVLLDGSSAPIPSSLHERFVTRADDENLIDVAYTTVDTRDRARSCSPRPHSVCCGWRSRSRGSTPSSPSWPTR